MIIIIKSEYNQSDSWMQTLLFKEETIHWPVAFRREERVECWRFNHSNPSNRTTESSRLYCITPWCQSVLWPSMCSFFLCPALSHDWLHTGTHSFTHPFFQRADVHALTALLSAFRCWHTITSWFLHHFHPKIDELRLFQKYRSFFWLNLSCRGAVASFYTFLSLFMDLPGALKKAYLTVRRTL